MVELKTDAEIAVMRRAGAVVAEVLHVVCEAATPGTRLLDLDALARDIIDRHRAVPVFLGYHPQFAPSAYPAVICTSVNDAALHGIPDATVLADGDLFSVDCAVAIDGWTADAATSRSIGAGRAEDEALIEVANRALDAGIAAAVAGGRLGDISAAVGRVARAAGCGLSVDYGGHGIGRQMHESPSVPNEGPAGKGMPLKPGLTLAVEPWFMAGGNDTYRIDADGWTIRSGDGSRAAHVEHTVAITAHGPQVLTLP